MHHIQHEISQCLAMYSIIPRPTMFPYVLGLGMRLCGVCLLVWSLSQNSVNGNLLHFRIDN